MAESDQLAVHSAVAPAGALGHPQHRSAQYGRGRATCRRSTAN